MKEQIRQGWHRVLVALMNGDDARADRERERLEAMVKVQRARSATRRTLARVS